MSRDIISLQQLTIEVNDMWIGMLQFKWHGNWDTSLKKSYYSLLFSYSVVSLRYDLNQSRISSSHNFHMWHCLLYPGMSSIENIFYISHTPCHRRVWIPKETVINFQERIFKVPKSLRLEKFGGRFKVQGNRFVLGIL